MGAQARGLWTTQMHVVWKRWDQATAIFDSWRARAVATEGRRGITAEDQKQRFRMGDSGCRDEREDF
jgi:hypothetical protein